MISATNTDLKQAIQDGSFREDLFYRLNVIELEVPPLSERPDDILPLAGHFLDGKHSLSTEAEQALLAHGWPGNVRELRNSIQRACLLAHEECIDANALNLDVDEVSAGDTSETAIRHALDSNNGVVAKAARSLGMSRQALYRRMEKYGIEQ